MVKDNVEEILYSSEKEAREFSEQTTLRGKRQKVRYFVS